MSGHWLANLLGIGRAKVIDDTGDLQLMQVTEGAAGSGFADRVLDKVKRLTEFGFSSVPPIDSEVVMIRRGGDRACSLVIATSHRPSRPKNLKPGDVALYDVRGAIIKLTEHGLEIDCAGLEAKLTNCSKVTLDAPDVVLTGTLHVAGEITAMTGGSAVGLGALRDAYNAHHHTGVTTGSGSTGGTDHSV